MLKYPEIALISVYDQTEPEQAFSYRELYYLLGERKTEESISHNEMPSWQEHVNFVRSKPYREWFLIYNAQSQVVGCTYVTKQNEIGISIFDRFRRQRYASATIYAIIEYYAGEQLFANINPENEKSIELFKRFGFTHVQNTLRRVPISNVLMSEPYSKEPEQLPQT